MNKRKFRMFISGVILMILAIVIFTIGFVDYDKSRIRSSSFVECDVSKSAMKCETFIRADKILHITKIHESTLSHPLGGDLFFMETPIGMINEFIVQYEALVHGTIPNTAYVNLDRTSKSSKYFEVIGDRIEYKWYFKSRFGTIYRMYTHRNPSIVQPRTSAFNKIVPSMFLLGLCFFMYRWLY